MANELLDEVDYKKVLSCYKKDVEYISARISVGESIGFMGSYTLLEIKFFDENKEKIKKFFVKTMPEPSLKTQITIIRNVYEKEKFYYNFLIREYEKYGFDVSFAPKFYYSKGCNLILENLDEKLYKISNRNDYNDLTNTEDILKSLALFHGASIMYEEKMSEKTGKLFRLNEKYPEIFAENYFNLNDKLFCTPIYDTSIRFLNFLIKVDPEKYKPELRKYFTEDYILSGIKKQTKYRNATGHGDLWYNNIFLQNNNKSKIIDFQLLRYSPPVFDVLLFMYLNYSKEFRVKYMKKLLQKYYDLLSNTLSEHGYNITTILPVDQFNECVRFVETTVLFQTLCIGMLCHLPSDIVQEMSNVMDNDNWIDLFYICCEKAYYCNKKYKKFIIDIIDDFYASFL